jgi:hypothetical protein
MSETKFHTHSCVLHGQLDLSDVPNVSAAMCNPEHTQYLLPHAPTPVKLPTEYV